MMRPRTLPLIVILCIASVGSSCSSSSGDGGDDDNTVTPPVFAVDSGVRVDNASNPKGGIGSDGTYYLTYDNLTNNKLWMATSTDGLTFTEVGEVTETIAYADHHSRYLLMSDGRYRTFVFSTEDGGVISRSTADGINPTQDAGLRYLPVADDNNEIGIVQVYPDPEVANGYIMLYLGDLHGRNNARIAVSTDGGLTFTFQEGNVLGDDDAGGGPNSFVDPFSLLSSDVRRLFVMGNGCSEIASFITTDGLTYTREEGARLSISDFTEFTVISLHDPVVLALPDGRYRIYVIARLSDADNDYAIVSATSTP